jgi:hypothetical protein
MGDTGPVKRDVARVREFADRLSADLHRGLGPGWNVSVGDDLVLTVTSNESSELVALDADVAVDNWPAEAWSERYREFTLDDDASEAVSGELFEVLRMWEVSWPQCPEHGRPVDVCGTTWTCSGRPPHDLAQVGSLGAE